LLNEIGTTSKMGGYREKKLKKTENLKIYYEITKEYEKRGGGGGYIFIT
jgi:hypothetical protein